MKKRIISALLALSMVVALPVSTVLADETLPTDSITSGQETSVPETPTEDNSEDSMEDVTTETPTEETPVDEIEAADNNLVATYADELTYGDLTYEIENNQITITDCNENAVSVDIPNEIDGIPVTSIGKYAFFNCKSLTNIIIPNSIIDIDYGAFSLCDSLTSITIPSNVTYIGEDTFYGCTNLTSINIPNGVTYIGHAAFSLCDSLTSITIPNSVTSIESGAFAHCKGLTSITIPDSVKSIGDLAFNDCISLTNINVSNDNLNYSSVDGVLFNKNKTMLIRCSQKNGAYTVPNSVTAIEDYAFAWCTGLTSLTIPESVTYIGDDVFSYCKSLTKITIPNNFKFIGSYAFGNCHSLINITIPDGVTGIRDEAFEYCYSLTSITIPDSVVAIGDWAFDYCTSLTDVYYAGSESDWKAIYIGRYNEPLLSATIHYNSTGSEDTNKITGILCSTSGCDVIWTCKNESNISGSVTRHAIEISVKEKNSLHEYITAIPESGDVFPWEAEPYNIGKTSVSKITVSGSVNKVLSIAPNSFKGYTNLVWLEVNCIKEIGSSAFEGCKSLSMLKNNGWSISKINNCAFKNCSSLADIVSSRSIEYIGDEAFSGCKLLNSEDIRGITYIGEKAFEDCESMTLLGISRAVTEIGAGAFEGCKNLTIKCYENSVAHKYAVEHNIKYILVGEEYEYKVYYSGGEEKFNVSLEDLINKTSSTVYSPEMAHMMIAMCNSVYNKDDISKSLFEMGFEDVRPYNYAKELQDKKDTATYTFARKTNKNGKEIIFVAIRGTGDIGVDNKGWLSNILGALPELATGVGIHDGFKHTTDNLYEDFKRYVGDFDNKTFVITGFSRGAAVANLLELRLSDAGVSSANVYGYNFACPDVAVGLHTGWNWLGEHNNMFNISDNLDPVSLVPGQIGTMISRSPLKIIAQWGKYGQSRWFLSEYSNVNVPDLIKYHDQSKYLKFLGNKDAYPQFDSFMSRESRIFEIDDNGKMIVTLCPVDVTVKDKNGNIIASVINNEPNYYNSNFGDVIICVSGDKKAIFVLGEQPLTIYLTGTDNGKMDYYVDTVKLFTEEILSEKSFENVELTAGKEMLSMIDVEEVTGVGDDVSRVPLYVIDDKGEPEKEVLPDGNGTEVPISNNNKPTTPIAPNKPSTPDNGGSSSNTNTSIVIPVGGTNTESMTIKIDNKVTGKTSKVTAKKTGSSVTVKLGTENNGYYANVYTTDDEYICSALIENGRAKFNFPDGIKIKIVIDSIAYGEDVSSAARIHENDEADNNIHYILILFFVGTAIIAVSKRFCKKI